SAVEIRGAVVLPGTYEVIGEETIGDMVDLAGGPLPTAQLDRATITRLNENNRYTITDLGGADLLSVPARTGDVVTIPASTSTSETVVVEGAVHEGPAEEGSPRQIPLEPILIEVPYTPGLSVLRVLEQFGGPTNFAEPERSFIIRGEDNQREPIPDLGTLWGERQWDRDIALAPGDRLVVPLKRLTVAVGGSVNEPDAFPFTSGYAVGDYLELAGGIDEENGSPNQLFFAEPDGTLTKVDVDTPVPIGTNIYVGRSGWGQAKRTFNNIFTVTGWVTGIFGFTTAVIEFVRIFSPGFP
ncbi:MAG: SLBB domain-containing protein, partial [Spirochaetota bacterium]